MGEIIKFNSGETEPIPEEKELLETTEDLLTDVAPISDSRRSLSIPVAELSALGAGIASLIPALNTVTETITAAEEGRYILANAEKGDVLKQAKNMDYWGAIKTADGKSKMARFQQADPTSVTIETAAALNPATIMMAAALFSIEKDLGVIKETQKQILSFLKIEERAEIMADVQTLTEIVRDYKLNWDNEHYVASNHKLVLDIQRTARKNINAYRNQIGEVIEKKKSVVVTQSSVDQTFDELEKKFKYYRLSLYTFSLASLMEIMLSGNFKEDYIDGIRTDIMELTESYRNLFEDSSVYLEKLGGSSLQTNLLKDVGTAGETVGRLISNIPLIKKGPVDEFLQNRGANLTKNVDDQQNKDIHQFAANSNPMTGIIIDKMNDMIQIYNHTEQICIDDKKIYLIAN